MTKPMLLAEFTRLPPVTRAVALDGLAGAIDMVAEAAPATHRFLRYQWFAAALATYGGAARTILIEHDGDPVIAMPFVATGWRLLGMAEVPGGNRPFRGFPAASSAPDSAFDTLVERLALDLIALRFGPAPRDDVIAVRLIDAARLAGWTILDRQAVSRARSGDELFWSNVKSDTTIAAMLSKPTAPTDMVDWLLVRPGLTALLGRAFRPLWEHKRQVRHP